MLVIVDCPGILSNLYLRFAIVFRRNELLTLSELPSNLYVKGNLDLWNCKQLTTLPSKLKIGGNLKLWNCEEMTRLPGDLIVEGDLLIHDSAGCRRMPMKYYLQRSSLPLPSNHRKQAETLYIAVLAALWNYACIFDSQQPYF